MPPGFTEGGDRTSLHVSRRVFVILGVAAAVLLVGVGIFLMVRSNGNGTEVPPPPEIPEEPAIPSPEIPPEAPSLPPNFLLKYFRVDRCDDETRCGLTADPDIDGLDNEDEEHSGTDPTNSDTDEDGLADGDEEHVYQTKPLRQDSDGDGFDDGREVHNGYSPSIASSEKMAQVELNLIADRILEFGLHEPTCFVTKQTGCSGTVTDEQKGKLETATWSVYRNEKQGFELRYPSRMRVVEDIYRNEGNFQDHSFVKIAESAESQTFLVVDVNEPGTGFEFEQVKTEETTVAGLAARRTIYRDTGSSVLGPVTVVFAREHVGQSDSYLIVYYPQVEDIAEIDGSEFARIIETFRFFEQSGA
jgi:hypothetical protein